MHRGVPLIVVTALLALCTAPRAQAQDVEPQMRTLIETFMDMTNTKAMSQQMANVVATRGVGVVLMHGKWGTPHGPTQPLELALRAAGFGPGEELRVRVAEEGILVLETPAHALRRARSRVRRQPGRSIVDEFLAERREQAERGE